MVEQENKTFTIEDATVKFSNFSGKTSAFNKDGRRSFTVELPEDIAEEMSNDGWTVRWLKPKEIGDPPGPPVIEVFLRYDFRPPRVVLLTATSRTQLPESAVEVLDWADIKTLDFVARGFNWEVNGKTGIKAYLQSLFVTIEEDVLERKYGYYDSPPDDYNE